MQKTRVDLADRLVQVVIRVVTLGLGIGESAGKILSEARRRYGPGLQTGWSKEVFYRRVDGRSPDLIECGPQPSMRNCPREDPPTSSEIVVSADNTLADLVQKKMEERVVTG